MQESLCFTSVGRLSRATETARPHRREGLTFPISKVRMGLNKEKAQTEVGSLSEKVWCPLSIKCRLREKSHQLCGPKATFHIGLSQPATFTPITLPLYEVAYLGLSLVSYSISEILENTVSSRFFTDKNIFLLLQIN